MPDELKETRHAAGTVGLSTRGRDTGDGQFFINLVENRTLEFEYTVFGRVTNPRGGADLESILEGTLDQAHQDGAPHALGSLRLLRYPDRACPRGEPSCAPCSPFPCSSR